MEMPLATKPGGSSDLPEASASLRQDHDPLEALSAALIKHQFPAPKFAA